MQRLSIIIPAKNEAQTLQALLTTIREQHPDAELIVVDDASTDATAEIASQYGARLVSHPYSMGNGAAVKAGARIATGEIFVFLDGDGQHDPRDIPLLLEPLTQTYEMTVGARSAKSQASIGRMWANGIYNRLASLMVGQRIADLTSGFRAVKAEKFREFLYLLPNGFSYPTTITMSFFRAGYAVKYVPVQVMPRSGQSHIQPLRDGLRFLLIIFKVGTLYSPLKIFFPVSLALFLTGICYYIYTYATVARFTNMSALLFVSSITIFLVGLVSEQVTALMYRKEQ